MKQILPLLFGCFLSCCLSAQDVSIYPDQLDYEMQADLTDEYAEPVLHSWLINTSTETIQLKWEISITGSDCPGEWKYKVCDNVQCYNSTVTSNVNPGSQPNVPVVIAPGDTTIIDIHVNPKLVAGSCSFQMIFSEVSNPNNPLLLATEDYSVVISALTSAAGEVHKKDLKVFPNPSQGLFTINGNASVKNLTIFSLLGKELKSFAYTPDNQYDISPLPDGMYLVSMKDASGRTLKTVRLTKRNNQP